jgi:hypothetical protein
VVVVGQPPVPSGSPEAAPMPWRVRSTLPLGLYSIDYHYDKSRRWCSEWDVVKDGWGPGLSRPWKSLPEFGDYPPI